MEYIRDMLNREEANTKELEEILNNKSIKKIVLRSNNHIDNDTILNLRGTKALLLEDMSNTDKEYDNRESWGELLLSVHDRPMGINVTTWSSLVRNAVEVIKPQLNYVKGLVDFDEFRATFDKCLNDICETQEFRLNSNCPRRLFREAEEADLIHSSVYMNNKNHFIPIGVDEHGVVWGLCAVYTGEIIIMLEALLDTIHTMMEEYGADKNRDVPYHTMVITYINREDLAEGQDIDVLEETISDIDNELVKLDMSKDIIKIQSKLNALQTLTVDIYSSLEELQKKYGLTTLDDVLKSVK